MSNEPMDDETYSRAMNAMIIVCVDIVIVDRKRETVYLAHRQAKPLQGLWCIGGRVRAGEPFAYAAQRKLAQEAGITVNVARLHFVIEDRTLWSERQQEPQNAGSDNLCHIYACELTDGELEAVTLDPTEYASNRLAPYSREQLVHLGVHQRILDLYDDIFSKRE